MARIVVSATCYIAAPLGRSGGGDMCDGCVDAGHLEGHLEGHLGYADDLVGDEAGKQSTRENGVKEPAENQPTLEEPAGKEITEKENCNQQQPVEEPEIENVANNNINQKSDLVDHEVEIDDGKDAEEEEEPSVQQPEAQTNNPTLLQPTDKVDQTKSRSDSSESSREKQCGPGPGQERDQQMSSKLSVTSLASAESAASFSFSADSLGEILDWIVCLSSISDEEKENILNILPFPRQRQLVSML